MSQVVCVGAINVDVFARAPSMPGPGETVLGTLVEILPGGKGANQAVAALRMGARVALVGAVGTDQFSEIPRSFLQEEGIETTWISQTDEPTGTALIVVDESGEKSVVFVPGANSTVSPASFANVKLDRGDVCLLQNEIPEHTNLALVDAARAAGGLTILNLAPYRPTDPKLLSRVSYLVLNEIEFAELTNTEVTELTPARVAGMLAGGAVLTDNVLVTLGAEGVVARLAAEVTRLAGHSVPVTDTTGAGDAFCGAFAAVLARGSAPLEALSIANGAAAISVQRRGAAPGMPHFDEVSMFMAKRSEQANSG